MGSLSFIVLGATLLVASFVLLQKVRPREGRPGPAWAQSNTMSTVLAVAMVVGLVFGVSLVFAGAFG